MRKRDEHFRSTPCQACGCCAEADVHHRNGHAVYDWYDPDPECDCGCHEAWRMVQRRPAVRSAA